MSSTRFSSPAKVMPDAIRMRTETADGGFRVGFVVDAQSHGSPLLLGLEWIRPGTELSSWEADAETHETYYVQQGRIRVSWQGDDAAEVEVGPGESFYFPPSRTYTVENVGEDEVFVIWGLTPSPQPS
jgi:mannose-6-phosphate isomerase-like protein (cupin superfamily)